MSFYYDTVSRKKELKNSGIFEPPSGHSVPLFLFVERKKKLAEAKRKRIEAIKLKKQ